MENYTANIFWWCFINYLGNFPATDTFYSSGHYYTILPHEHLGLGMHTPCTAIVFNIIKEAYQSKFRSLEETLSSESLPSVPLVLLLAEASTGSYWTSESESKEEDSYSKLTSELLSALLWPHVARQETLSMSSRGPAHNRKWISRKLNSSKERCYFEASTQFWVKWFWAMFMNDMRVPFMMFAGKKFFHHSYPLKGNRSENFFL